MSTLNELSNGKEAINEYIKSWNEKHPSVVKVKQKEEEYKNLKLQYDDAFKTYFQNLKKGTGENYQVFAGHNVPGVEELIRKNKVRYVRIEHNYQYIHVNELQVFDEFNNNVAENSTIGRMRLTLTIGTGSWDSTSRLQWISFLNNNREVTKRYNLNGKYFRRDSSITVEIPVNFSTSSINGMYYYVGNDGTVIKRTKLEMYNEKSGVWKTLTDKVEGGRGKWVKNRLGKINFSNTTIERDTTGPEAYASSEGWRGDANKIIDGNYKAEAWWPNANSNHTYARENEYVEVDLKKEHNISKIRIYNRPDCCRWRLWKAQMKLYNSARQQVGRTYTLGSRRMQDYNIEFNNQPKKGLLPKAFYRWIGMDDCHKACAEDDECEIGLYRPRTYISGKGWTYGNQCLHYNNEIGKSEQINNPDYQYVAYNKPVWNDMKNTHDGFDMLAYGDDNSNFKYLGKMDTFSACKNKSTDSDKGPFDSVLYYSSDFKTGKWRKHCYGGVLGGSKNQQQIDGVYTSIPPGGQTGTITKEYMSSLQDVIYLNKKLSELGNEIIDLNLKMYKRGKDYDTKIKELNFSVDNKKLKEVQHLEVDRKKLVQMEQDLKELNKHQEDNEFILTTNQYKYIGLTVAALTLVGLTIKQINK